MLARLQVEAGDWEGAREVCRDIIAVDPTVANAWRTVGVASLRLDDRDEARRAFEQATQHDPEDAASWRMLGTLLSEKGHHGRALAALVEASRLAPDNPRIQLDLARAHDEIGDTRQALAGYDRVLELDPNLPEAVNEKALLLSRTGRAREAVELLRESLNHRPDEVETLNNIAWILVNESLDPEEGYRHARRAAGLAPEDPVVLDTLGWAAIRSGRPAEGILPLTAAWEQTRDAEVRAHLGIAMAESGNTREGMSHVRAAVRDRPSLEALPEVRKWNR
jgi:Flp pilus assembly protein TadD